MSRKGEVLEVTDQTRNRRREANDEDDFVMHTKV